MISNKDFVQLSEYCFNVFETLRTIIQGRYLSSSVVTTLDDLERCVNQPAIRFPAKRVQGYEWNPADSQGDERDTH